MSAKEERKEGRGCRWEGGERVVDGGGGVHVTAAGVSRVAATSDC